MYYLQIIEQSFLIFPMIMGIYITYNIFGFSDLSVDGSFVLGASSFARLIELGFNPWISLLLAIILGGLSGIFLALIQGNGRIEPIISGILLAFILNSLSLVLMGRPNIGLLEQPKLFNDYPFLSLFSLVALVAILFSLLIKSKIGLRLKAFGNNPELFSQLGFSKEKYRLFGISLSSSLVAFSGAITAQRSGYADINMGLGQALTGICMILLGRELIILFNLKNLKDSMKILFSFLGVLFYFVVTNWLIKLGVDPSLLKMAIGGFIILFLVLSKNNKQVIQIC